MRRQRQGNLLSAPEGRKAAEHHATQKDMLVYEQPADPTFYMPLNNRALNMPILQMRYKRNTKKE
jgi:hypothetical protein